MFITVYGCYLALYRYSVACVMLSRGLCGVVIPWLGHGIQSVIRVLHTACVSGSRIKYGMTGVSTG